MTNICPKCKAPVNFECLISGKAIVSVKAICSSCGASGSAAVDSVSVAQFNRHPPSEATQFSMLSAHAVALKNICT